MKRLVKYLKVILPVAGIMILVSACQKNSATKIKSVTATFKAAAQKTSSKSTLNMNNLIIPVKGGSLNLSSALLNFGNVTIQENSGNDGQNTGGSTADGKDNETSKDKSDSGDIVLAGPFTYNLSSDTVTLGQVQLYPGTFKKVDLSFILNNDTNFQGNSIVLKGTFTPGSGTAIPFILKSKFAGQIELNLTKAITVSANSKVSIAIVFDFSKWMTNLDFGTATQTAGTIIIDVNHNTVLSNSFESALSQQGAELDEEHGDTTDKDKKENKSNH
jgi:hypothetical protein